ncbi:putative HTH-type transcriptional regulator [Corynebacterium provencense]|uniref:Putative HTH-type transcriptional regulator n=1 Tax=Corynebacterium provencense TaxID=1737425 RepID=A0A2Z3YQ91_9CORY|nr:MarR family transcriptional regulator [Corynebacterium provencense]AWT26329.1 putative HTH-type transcriptional regulator [Corynebacterium provencense]
MNRHAENADALGILVKQAQSLLNRAMDRELRPMGLTVTQFACLRALAEDPGISGSELARRMFVSRQSMNGVVTGLEKRELVARSEFPGPRRDRAMTLTGDATELLERAESAVADVVATLTRGVLPEDIETTLRVLTTACANLTD